MAANFIRQSGVPPRVWESRYAHIGGLMDDVRYDTHRPNSANTKETTMNRADRVLYRRAVGAAPHMRTGRQRIGMTDRTMFDGMYTCKTNLAGELYLATRTGKMYEIPIRPISTECGHTDCRMSARIKPGGVFDSIVMLLPVEYSDQMDSGLWPKAYIPEPHVWQQHYHYAVKASRKLHGSLQENKRKLLCGLGFDPQSHFGETVLYMIRLFELPGIAVYHAADRMQLFENAFTGKIGSSARLANYFVESTTRHVLDTSGYSRAFYVVSQLKGKFPDIPFPLQDFCNHIERITRNPFRAFHTMVTQYYLRPARKLLQEIDIDELQPQDGLSERDLVSRNISIIAAAEKVRYERLQREGKSKHAILSDAGLIMLYNTRQIFATIDEFVNGEFASLSMDHIVARTNFVGHMELDYVQPSLDEMIVQQSLSEHYGMLPGLDKDETFEEYQEPVRDKLDTSVNADVLS